MNHAVFAADIPDDALTDDVERPNGCNVATAIAEALKRRGVATTLPEQHEHFGWAFYADDYYWLLQWPGEWLLVVEDRASWLHRIIDKKRVHKNFEQLLATVRAALDSDPRFRQVRWMDDYDGKRSTRDTNP
jgi:hypothetical protein